MSRVPGALCLILAFSLTMMGCAPATRTPPLLLTPTPVGVAESAPPQGVIVASAVVVPARVTRLSFPIGGRVREVHVAEGERVQAGQALVALHAPELEYARIEAEAALRAAEAEYRYWRYPRNKPPERRELAQMDVRKAEAALQVAQAAQAQAVITAPFDGTIVSIEVAPGSVVQPAEVVLVLADLDHLRLETTDLSERQIANISPGDRARVTIEALGIALNGRVVAIAPRAETLGGDVVFKVTIALNEQAPGLRWGMRAEVEIVPGGSE